MDLKQKIVTSGVYASVKGRFIFQIGPTKVGDTLGVVRIGGHREIDETGWECARREALEEASIQVIPVTPPNTYWTEIENYSELKLGKWSSDSDGQVKPIVVTIRSEDYITPLYLGYTLGEPVPTREAKALILLSPLDVCLIVTKKVTLKQYINNGGTVIFREELPQHLLLEPFVHLKILCQLLQMHPEILDKMC